MSADTEGAVRFMITGPARTGSTMLTLCLQKHPSTFVHGEVFSPDGPVHLDRRREASNLASDADVVTQRNRDPIAFLHDVVLDAGDRRAVGFKFKHEELLMRRWRKVRQAIVEDSDVRVVHLTRENLLERFLSAYVAVNVTHVYNVWEAEKRPPSTSLRLPRRACKKNFDVTLRRQDEFRDLFSEHATLEVTYEQLVADRAATLALVEEFLGIEVCDLDPVTQKLNNRSMRDVIENYAELEEYFAETRYASFFTEAPAHNRTSPSDES